MQQFWYQEMHFEMSARRRPLCFGLHGLRSLLYACGGVVKPISPVRKFIRFFFMITISLFTLRRVYYILDDVHIWQVPPAA